MSHNPNAFHRSHNVYRCRVNGGPIIEIEANSQDDAEVMAARVLQCSPGEVVARYNRTIHVEEAVND